MIKDSTITKIYLNNLDKNLWYCDSLAYTYMKSWVGKAQFNSYWYSEAEKFDLLDAFKKFYEQHLTTVITFPKNIDLSSSNVRETLNSRGYKLSEIDEILGAYERQTKIITSRRNKQTVNKIVANSFAIAKLGWINCDQFYYEPNAKEANIIANSTNTEKFDFISFTLIINNRRIALGGILNNKYEYCFTGNSKPYTKLPIGEKATIVGLTYKNDKPYFGTKEITLTEKGSYKVDLTISSIKEIDEKLNKLN
jgi:antitoxin component HigA of HigAB toxin-antitoxin module